jgi:flagellar motility protein MotE (MotC chaperone)
MIRFLRDLRLVPIALIASACLLALKTADLVLDGGYLMTADTAPAGDDATAVVRTTPDVAQADGAPRSWAQQMLNFPDPSRAAPTGAAAPLPALAALAADKINGDITGSVEAKGGDDNAGAKAKGEAVGTLAKDGKDVKDVKPASGTVIPTDGSPPSSDAERAILGRLAERRQELDTRARELDIREGLIAAAEKRVEARLAELKQVESQISVATEKKDQAEAARLKGLVTMYENMKPRDAAKIFDRLELRVLLDVASQINPRRMSDILAQMAPETAERLTVELANRAQTVAKGGAGELPKIEGRPTTP